MRLWIAIALTACWHRAPEPVPAQPPLPADAAIGVAAADAATPPNDAPELVCEPFDWRNPACRNDPRACLHGAYCKCPSPPDAENPACWAVMPCPKVPDIRIRACQLHRPTCPDPADADNPNCPSSLIGRVIAFDASKGLITVGLGSAAGVSRTWRATLLRGDSNEALADGEIEIVRVGPRATVGKVRVREDVVQRNPRVELRR